MRIALVFIVIAFGVFADFHSNQNLMKEKQLEALNIYRSTLFGTHQIVNDLLQQMQIIKEEALKSNDFDKEFIEFLDRSINDASELLEKLSNVDDITSQNIKSSIKPE